MATTTTSSIKKASTELSGKCKETEEKMKQKMQRAGCAEYKSQRVLIPRARDEGDDVLMVGLNGEKFYFLRGQSISMPDPLAEILVNTGNI